MKIVVLSGSIVGSKTRTAMNYVVNEIVEKYPENEVVMVDLADYNIQFSDGRNFQDYEGDTKYVAETLMSADAIVMGTPIFQASIPGTLKNIFDLLPEGAFLDKIVSIVVTAGSSKHFLVAEQQLKPILSYMKAQIVPTYVFIEEKDFYQKQIVNDDVLFRLNQLVEDTILLSETYQAFLKKQEEKYGF